MNTKELQLVTLEQAKRLKTVGFNWGTTAYWVKHPITKEWIFRENTSYLVENNLKFELVEEYTAPTVALALKWIRDEKNLHYDGGRYFVGKNFRFWILDNAKSTDPFDTYEAAESALLDELLTILEQQSHV